MAFRLGFEQGMGDKPALAIEERLTRFGSYRYIASIRQQFTGVGRIRQVGLEYFVANGYTQAGASDGEECFDTVIQIALHHVGTAQIDLLVAIIAKVEDATVLQKTPDNTPHTNIVTYVRNTRLQTAYTTYNQVNTYSCL